FIFIVGFLLFYYSFKLLNGIFHIGNWFHDLGDKRKHIKAREKTNQGLIELTEGHWERAERHLIQGAKYSEVPLLNYLSAAKAAQELGDEQRRDTYLALAHDSTRGTDTAVGVKQAQLQLGHGQNKQALATLNHLRDIAPHHPQILKLLRDLYIQLRDWTQLRDILPLLKKNHVISDDEKMQLEQRIYLE